MNIKDNVVITLTFLVVSMLLGGCVSPPKLPVGPVYFVDAKTGKSVAPVLLVQRCSTFSGITTGMGHGPQRGKNGFLFANPFIYYSEGSPFKVKYPLSTAIIIPFLRIGIIHKGIILNGVDVYAKGYKVGDVPFIWLLNEPRPATFKLEPLDETESKKEFTRISDGLRKKNFEVLSTYPPMGEDEVLEFDFSRKELKMMETFFGADTKVE